MLFLNCSCWSVYLSYVFLHFLLGTIQAKKISLFLVRSRIHVIMERVSWRKMNQLTNFPWVWEVVFLNDMPIYFFLNQSENHILLNILHALKSCLCHSFWIKWQIFPTEKFQKFVPWQLGLLGTTYFSQQAVNLLILHHNKAEPILTNAVDE